MPKEGCCDGLPQSVDEVYAETARHILEHDLYPWTVLWCIDHTANSPSLAGQRPSWAPRWDEGFRLYWLGYQSMWYRAGGEQPAAFHAEFMSDASLETRAILLDTVSWTSPAFINDELLLAKQKETALLQNLWQELEQGDQGILYGPSFHDCEYKFSLAITAGRASDKGPAQDDPTHHWSVYQTYKTLIAVDNANEELVTEESKPPNS